MGFSFASRLGPAVLREPSIELKVTIISPPVKRHLEVSEFFFSTRLTYVVGWVSTLPRTLRVDSLIYCFKN